MSLVAIYHLFWMIEIHLVPGAGNIRPGHLWASARAQGDVGRAGGSEQNHHIRARVSYSSEGCGLWLWGPAGCASRSPAGWTSTTTRSTRTPVSSKLEAVSNSALSGQLKVVCANQYGNGIQIRNCVPHIWHKVSIIMFLRKSLMRFLVPASSEHIICQLIGWAALGLLILAVRATSTTCFLNLTGGLLIKYWWCCLRSL